VDTDVVEILKQKLSVYAQEKSATALYLHTDKAIYAPGENIWFKAYVLSGTVTDNKVIYVRLADKNKTIIISEQFPMKNLLGNGEIMLPDSLREGDYTLYAYTDRMINFNEQDIFTQPIHIIKNVTGGMITEAAVTDTTKLRQGEEVNINVKVRIGDDPINGVKGAYRLYSGDKFIRGGKLTTNSLGETQINFIYPQLDTQQNLKLNITFNKDDDRTELNLNLPPAENPVLLAAYAEGNHLIARIPTRLTITATDINHNPVRAVIILKKADQEVSRIQINANGIGVFNLTALSGSKYTLALADNRANKVTHFPKVENRGYSMRVLRQKDKALHAIVKNTGENGAAYLVLRNYESILWNKVVNLASGDSLNVILPVTDLNKDIFNLAIFDQTGNLKAERLFLNKAEEVEGYSLDIQTDEQAYGTRKKVTVKIVAKDSRGLPVKANLSISAVTAGRTDISSYRNILQAYQYRFLRSGLTIKGSDEKDINDMLLASSWQSLNWPDVIAYKPRGSINLIDNTDGVKGIIEPLRNNIKLAGWQLQAGSEKSNIAIDANGGFNIPAGALLTVRGKELQWAGGVQFRESYRVKYKNEDVVFDNKILAGISLNTSEMFNTIATIQANAKSSKFGWNTINELGEVRIKNGVAAVADFWSANCDDYVCENNILNCILHPAGSPGLHKPEIGKTYSVINMAATVNLHVVYRGCKNIWYPDMIKNIYMPLDFTLPDYDKVQATEPQLISTVYWNPNINTDDNGKASFSFYTSDIKGDYRIMVQGITDKTQPIYGTIKFTVR
jgi:hypothetical protein